MFMELVVVGIVMDKSGSHPADAAARLAAWSHWSHWSWSRHNFYHIGHWPDWPHRDRHQIATPLPRSPESAGQHQSCSRG